MSTQESRPDREWENWPGRRPADEGLKRRLRALFTPVDEDEEIQALLAERGRELDEQTENLAATISDLERRERKTRELRAAVEDMLRQGSAELDDRHDELNVLAVELARREDAVSRAEADIAERRREAGAVELRRAAVERREVAAGEREAALDRIAAELQEREQLLREGEQARERLAQREAALDARSAELDVRERLATGKAEEIASIRRSLAVAEAELRERESRLADLDARAEELEGIAAAVEERQRALEAAEATLVESRVELERAVAGVSKDLGFEHTAEPAAADAHVCFVPGERYRIVAADGPAPEPGTELRLEDVPFRVLRVGSSPLPGDRRRCAFLEPLEPGSTAGE